jgi:ABC-type phosphate transport system substrate-binding protein
MTLQSVSYGARAITAYHRASLARIVLCCAVMLCVPLHRSEAQSSNASMRQTVAIVVNPHSTVTDLSFAELRRIFLGQQQFWPDRSKITLLVRAPVAPERSVVLDQIYRMDEDQFRQYWIGKMFRAEIAGGPKIVYSSDMAMNLVGAIPGSITFVLASAVTPNTKVLRIDGKLPSEAGYPLK